MSIRLEEATFPFEGKEYVLRCNMAVLDELQELHNGDFGEVMNLPTIRAIPEILAAMLNDYADEQGWPERFTAKGIARKTSYSELIKYDILGIFTRAIIPPAESNTESNEGKN